MSNEMYLNNFIARVQAKTCPQGATVHFPDGMSRSEAELLCEILQNPNCPPQVTVEIKEKTFPTYQFEMLAKALKSGRCPSELALVFTRLPVKVENDASYVSSVETANVRILANALSSGRCPRGLAIVMNGSFFNGNDFQLLADALKSGQCPPGLTLELGNTVDKEQRNNKKIISGLADALQSGNCPPGLTLIVQKCFLDSTTLGPLVRALKSGRCPRWLTLDLKQNQLKDAGSEALSDALRSGRCPLGLSLDLAVNEISPKGIRALSLPLLLGKCPERLSLNLSHNALGQEGYDALAVALKSGLCPRGLTVNLENTQPPNNLAEFINTIQPQFAPPELTLTGVDDPTAQRVASSNAVHRAATQEIFTFLCVLERNGFKMPRDVVGTLAKWVYPVQLPAEINQGRDFLRYLTKQHPNTTALPSNSLELLSMQVAIKTLVGKYQKLPLIFHRKRATELVKRAEGCNSTLALRTLLKNEEQRFFSNGRGFWTRFQKLEAPLKNRIKLSWGYFGTLQKAIEEAGKIPEPATTPQVGT